MKEIKPGVKMQCHAVVPDLCSRIEQPYVRTLVEIFSGVALLSLLAQIAIPLPWTPVPITGQTMGVLFIGLCWGRKQGLITLASYIALGAAGLPLFALGKSGLSVGPTLGYMVGFFLSVFVVGGLADRGWTRTLGRCFLAGILSSVCVMSCGLFGLSFFVPSEALLTAGLWPFLPGDAIKTSLAVTAAWQFRQRVS